MIECVHAYWLLLWLIGLFSRYSHRNRIINYPWHCHGGAMESPDEYLGRLNFLGTRGFAECRGAPLHCRDGRSQVCVCVCVCVVHVSRLYIHRWTQQQWGDVSSSYIPIDFTSVSLYSNFISVASAVLWVCVCVYVYNRQWWTFLPLVQPSAFFKPKSLN